MTSPATSGRHLSKFEKNALMPPTATNFSIAAFCPAQPNGRLLVRQNVGRCFALLLQGPSAVVVVVRRRSSQNERLEYLENGST